MLHATRWPSALEGVRAHVPSSIQGISGRPVVPPLPTQRMCSLSPSRREELTRPPDEPAGAPRRSPPPPSPHSGMHVRAPSPRECPKSTAHLKLGDSSCGRAWQRPVRFAPFGRSAPEHPSSCCAYTTGADSKTRACVPRTPARLRIPAVAPMGTPPWTVTKENRCRRALRKC